MGTSTLVVTMFTLALLAAFGMLVGIAVAFDAPHDLAGVHL